MKKNSLPLLPVKLSPHSGEPWVNAIADGATILNKLEEIDEAIKGQKAGFLNRHKALVIEALETLKENEEYKLRMLYKKLAGGVANANEFRDAVAMYAMRLNQEPKKRKS